MSIYKIQTYDDTNALFHYEKNWSHGAWNASDAGESGTLSTTNDVNAEVKFTFPGALLVCEETAFVNSDERAFTLVAAKAFYYYGMRPSRGTSYGICIDCDPKNPNFIAFGAFNATDDRKNPPVMLYNSTFNEPGFHVVIIRNQQDLVHGVPLGTSQLTLDRFELEVVSDDELYATSTTTVTSSHYETLISPKQTDCPDAFPLLPFACLPPIYPCPLPSESFPLPPVAPPSTHRAPSHVGVIVGGVVAALAVISGALLVGFIYLLRVRRCCSAAANFSPYTLLEYVVRRSTTKGASQLERQGDFPFTWMPRSLKLQTRPCPELVEEERCAVHIERRVEVDAGPVEDTSDDETLPPLYDSINPGASRLGVSEAPIATWNRPPESDPPT